MIDLMSSFMRLWQASEGRGHVDGDTAYSMLEARRLGLEGT